MRMTANKRSHDRNGRVCFKQVDFCFLQLDADREFDDTSIGEQHAKVMFVGLFPAFKFHRSSRPTMDPTFGNRCQHSCLIAKESAADPDMYMRLPLMHSPMHRYLLAIQYLHPWLRRARLKQLHLLPNSEALCDRPFNVEDRYDEL